MGVCIAQLGGRFFLVAEADLAVDFTWPILLGGFVRQTRWQRLAWLTVIFFVAFIHPTSFLLFAACAAALGVASWDQPQCRRPALLLLIASGARFWLFRSGWDPIPEGAGEWGYLKYQLTTSLVHGLIFSIAGGWVACVGILGMYASRSFLRRVSQTLVVLGLLVSLVSSLYWAKDISHWALAVGFRGAALFIGSAFLAIGALAAWRFTEQGGNWAGGVALAAALIFSSTVSVQGYRWQQAIARFEALLRESPHACIERAAVMQFEGTPIPYWHLLSLAIVVQGRAPKTLIQEDGGCAKAAETGRIMLAPWHPRELSSRGWYQFPTQASLSNGDAPNRQLP
ncbi:MAG: hypothetical protein K1X64_21640 [Myxococcaceae bacterium]|nr:hypothetical protein [Myxococcaceae bacterium]